MDPINHYVPKCPYFEESNDALDNKCVIDRGHTLSSCAERLESTVGCMFSRNLIQQSVGLAVSCYPCVPRMEQHRLMARS